MNEAARMEGLCKECQTPLTISSAVIETFSSRESFRSLGPYNLRGVAEEFEIWTLSNLVKPKQAA